METIATIAAILLACTIGFCIGYFGNRRPLRDIDAEIDALAKDIVDELLESAREQRGLK